jgi:hypothetical protein
VNDTSGVSYFGFRDLIAGGTIYSSGVAAGTTNWYRLTVTLDDGTRTATMDVIDLTAGGAVVDLNGGAAGASFSHTWPAGQWVSPTNFVGLLGRASTTLMIDNIVTLQPAVQPPPTLQLSFSGANMQLIWSEGTLLEATNLAGPWIAPPGASSPLIVVPTSPRKFFRVQVP